MDLQAYFKKIRAMEERLKDPSGVLVSLETQDGGREGVRTEVPRRIAATMIVEGTASLARRPAQASPGRASLISMLTPWDRPGPPPVMLEMRQRYLSPLSMFHASPLECPSRVICCPR